MYVQDDEDGEGTLVILGRGETLTVELPGGNGETITFNPDGSVTDQDGFDLSRAYLT